MVSRPEIVALKPNTEVIFSVNCSLYLFLQAQRCAQPRVFCVGLKQKVRPKVQNVPFSPPDSHLNSTSTPSEIPLVAKVVTDPRPPHVGQLISPLPLQSGHGSPNAPDLPQPPHRVHLICPVPAQLLQARVGMASLLSEVFSCLVARIADVDIQEPV